MKPKRGNLFFLFNYCLLGLVIVITGVLLGTYLSKSQTDIQFVEVPIHDTSCIKTFVDEGGFNYGGAVLGQSIGGASMGLVAGNLYSTGKKVARFTCTYSFQYDGKFWYNTATNHSYPLVDGDLIKVASLPDGRLRTRYY